MLPKRLFDIALSLLLLVALAPVLAVAMLVAKRDTGAAIFRQRRVGRYGHLFTIYKLQTVHPQTRCISRVGRFLRRSKLDELPQLWNVLNGSMSFVGPRPDLPGYYDRLQGADRRLLNLRPGITSEAAIKYRDEERLLADHPSPQEYNDKVLFPDKVRMNLLYHDTRTFFGDLRIMLKTFLG